MARPIRPAADDARDAVAADTEGDPMRAAGLDHEARRQQWLLQALRGEAALDAAPGGLAGTVLRQQQGLRVYQANAAAAAARALAVAHPTVQQLLGEGAFAALAAALWHHAPPQGGDLGDWGEALAGHIDVDPQLAGEPYLVDMARLDWALHRAARAADDAAPVAGLHLLASDDPARLRIRLRAGHAVLVSAHPVHTLWAAHRSDAADRFQAARDALARGQGEAVRVARRGWAAEAERIDAATARFEQDLLRAASLDSALTAAAPGFEFEAWLIDSLRRDALAAVEAVEAEAASG